MSEWTSTDRRIGLASAVAIVLLSIVYLATGVIWLGFHAHDARTQGLTPVEPYLAILETIILLLTTALVGLFAAIHAYAPPGKKSCSRAAFGLAVLVAGIAGTVHFVQLTAIRR